MEDELKNENLTEEKSEQNAVENKDLIPMEQLREYMKNNNLPQPQDSFDTNLNDSFNDYLNSDDKEKEDQVKKQNKKRFHIFSKGKARVEGDKVATETYMARYDRETWFYKRHKDTVDKYVRKEEKQTKLKEDSENVIVVNTNNNEEDDVLRIGYFKMLLIVWFDLIICTILGNILFTPIHLVRFVSELFFKMKKTVAITVGIIVGIVIVVVGLILGVNYIMKVAQVGS